MAEKKTTAKAAEEIKAVVEEVKEAAAAKEEAPKKAATKKTTRKTTTKKTAAKKDTEKTEKAPAKKTTRTRKTTAKKAEATTSKTTTTPQVTTTQPITTTPPTTTTYETQSVVYNNYNLSEYDLNLMCAVVSSETGYCEDQAQKAVAHTILNRLKSDKFPNTMYEVVTQPAQYDAIWGYLNGQFRAELEPGSERWNHTYQLCIEAANEWDFTGNAFAYYNPNMCGYNSWFESLTLTYADQYGRFFTF